MPWIGFDNTFIGVFRAKVLIWLQSLFKGAQNKTKKTSLHPFAAQRHVQFGTRCQHEQEGLEDCEGYDQSKSRSPRICLAAYIWCLGEIESRFLCQNLILDHYLSWEYRRRVEEVRQTFTHTKNRGESLFGMVEGTISIIQDTDTIPKFGILLQRCWTRKRAKKTH